MGMLEMKCEAVRSCMEDLLGHAGLLDEVEELLQRAGEGILSKTRRERST
jgi:hypothetical protein